MHMADWEGQKPYLYKANSELSVKLLKGLMERDFDMPFTSNGTMDGELVNWIIAAGIVGERRAKVVEYVRLWHIGLGYFYWEL